MTSTQNNKATKLWIFTLIHFASILIIIFLASFILKDKLFAYSNDIYKSIFILLVYIIIMNIPVLLYLIIGDRVNPFSYIKINKNIFKGILQGLIIGAIVFVIFLAVNRFKFSKDIILKRDIYFIIGTMVIGLLEEIPMRGFYLQKFENKLGFLKANIFSSLIFTSLHAITLIGTGTNLVFSLILLFIISMWLGYIFKKTGSLWTVIIIHSIYNLAIFII